MRARSVKTKGTRMETAVTLYLRAALHDPSIERLRLAGPRDRGDIGNVRAGGRLIAIEVKNTTRADTAEHLKQAAQEAANYGALCGVVVQKRRGIGINTPETVGRQLVQMTLKDFTLLLQEANK